MPILYDIREAGNLKRKELSIIFTFLIIGISIIPSIVGHNDPTSISVYHNDFISMTADKGGVRGSWFQHDKLVASDGDIGEFLGNLYPLVEIMSLSEHIMMMIMDLVRAQHMCLNVMVQVGQRKKR